MRNQATDLVVAPQLSIDEVGGQDIKCNKPTSAAPYRRPCPIPVPPPPMTSAAPISGRSNRSPTTTSTTGSGRGTLLDAIKRGTRLRPTPSRTSSDPYGIFGDITQECITISRIPHAPSLSPSSSHSPSPSPSPSPPSSLRFHLSQALAAARARNSDALPHATSSDEWSDDSTAPVAPPVPAPHYSSAPPPPPPPITAPAPPPPHVGFSGVPPAPRLSVPPPGPTGGPPPPTSDRARNNHINDFMDARDAALRMIAEGQFQLRSLPPPPLPWTESVGGHLVLQEIQRGVRLRPTPVPDRLQVHQEHEPLRPRNMVQELRWTIGRRNFTKKQERMEKAKELRGRLSEDLDFIVTSVRRNKDATVEHLRELLRTIVAIEGEIRMPRSELEDLYGWPVVEIQALERLVDLWDDLTERMNVSRSIIDRFQEVAHERKIDADSDRTSASTPGGEGGRRIGERGARNLPSSTTANRRRFDSEYENEIVRLAAARAGSDVPSRTALKDHFFGPQVVSNQIDRLLSVVWWFQGNAFSESRRLYVGACSDITAYFQQDVGPILCELLQIHITMGCDAFEELNSSHLTKFDLSSKAARVHALLSKSVKYSDEIEGEGFHVDEECLIQVSALKKRLETDFHRDLSIRERRGEWDKAEQPSLRPVSTGRPIPQHHNSHTDMEHKERSDTVPSVRGGSGARSNRTGLAHVLDLVRSHAPVAEVRSLVSSLSWPLPELLRHSSALVRCAISVENEEALHLLSDLLLKASTKERRNSKVKYNRYHSDNATECLHSFQLDVVLDEWLIEATTKGNRKMMQVVIDMGARVNCRSLNGGHTPLHIAARRGDTKAALFLIEQGADPTLTNAVGDTALFYLGVKHFPRSNAGGSRAPSPSATNVRESKVDVGNPDLDATTPVDSDTSSNHSAFPFARYLFSSNLSDVSLVTDDGESFFAHKIVLSAHSSVFRVMLDNERRWLDSLDSDVPLPGVSSAALRLLLTYVYTGEIHIRPSRDNSLLLVELVELSSRFMLVGMKRVVEQVLIRDLNHENVMSLYFAAFQWDAPLLLQNTIHYILTHFSQLGKVSPSAVVPFERVAPSPVVAGSDPVHVKTLLHILQNHSPSSTTGGI